MQNNVRKGRCRNYGDCDHAGEEFAIEVGKPFECPECHQPLVPLDGPKVKSNKKLKTMPLIIGGIVVLAAIITTLFFVFRNTDDSIETDISNTASVEMVDSLTSTNGSVTNRNDTLVIKVENTSINNASSEENLIDVNEEVSEDSNTTTSGPAISTTHKSTIKSSQQLSYGNWTGGWKNGKPHGVGTLTYSTSCAIDSRDPKGRVAKRGEYIVGEWDNGHLVQGRWFKNDGTKEAIIIGKAE